MLLGQRCQHFFIKQPCTVSKTRLMVQELLRKERWQTVYLIE